MSVFFYSLRIMGSQNKWFGDPKNPCEKQIQTLLSRRVPADSQGILYLYDVFFLEPKWPSIVWVESSKIWVMWAHTVYPGWWQLKYFWTVHPYLGKWSNLASIFFRWVGEKPPTSKPFIRYIYMKLVVNPGWSFPHLTFHWPSTHSGGRWVEIHQIW